MPCVEGGGNTTCSLHCSSLSGLPFRILSIKLVKPKKGTTMETTGTGTVSNTLNKVLYCLLILCEYNGELEWDSVANYTDPSIK